MATDPQGLSGTQPDKPSAAPSDPSLAAAGDAGSSAPTRPEWVPAAHWDDAASALKLDSFGEHYNELATFHKEQTDKLAALPAKPEDVKFALPEGMQLPDGFVLDEANPLLAAARETVVAKKIDPAVANEFYGLFIKSQLAEHSAFGERLNSEKAKLGANAGERVDALNASLRAAIGATNTTALIGDLSKPGGSRIWTADQVTALEAIVKRITTQGAASPGAAPHAPAKKEIPWVQKAWPKRFAAVKG